MIINNENLFLIAIGIIWIIGAVIQDLKRREVDNIWNFSLIGIALAYRLAFSIYSSNYWYFLNGILGFVIFLILGNFFYYSRVFAGGDAKLLIALGTIIPLSYNWIINLKIFGYFTLLFLPGGSIYVFVFSLLLVFFNFRNFKKEFVKQVKNNKNFFIVGIAFFIIWIIFSFFIGFRISLFGLVFLLFPLLFIFAKSVEESCLVKLLNPDKITEGDWLYEDIIVNGKKIKASWDGVSKRELRFIREKYRRKILVKQGIPFTPGFLIGFLGVIFISWKWGLF